MLALGLLAVALSSSLYLSFYLLAAIKVFIITGVIYTWWLKNIVIVDAITVAVNYIWRMLMGVILIQNVPHPPISAWFIFGFFFVALLLVFGKRKVEVIVLGGDAKKHRAVFNSYTHQMFDYMISITAATIFLFYTLYCIYAFPDLRLTITIPIMAYIVFRYVYIISINDIAAQSPEKMIYDRPLLIALILWTIMVGGIFQFATFS
jgi:4-hydroxybenzoate polyprenyltransferase